MIQLTKRIWRAIRNEAQTGMTVEELFRDLFSGAPTASGVSVSPDTAMQASTVYACVRVLAESVAQLPFPVYRRLDNGGKERDPSHPLYRILNWQPNRWQTAFEFREMMMGHVVLRGNAYALIVRVGGRVHELIPLHPDHVMVEQRRDWSVRYHRLVDGNWVAMPPGSVFHLRGMASNGPIGMSPITAYREAVGLSISAQRLQARSFSNGAKFHGYLKHPGPKLSPEARKNMRESFDRQHSGDNAWSTPLLEEGTEWVKVGMSAEDAQLIETRKFQRSEIASIFRVPPHKIGDLERATFSNIEHQALEFVTDTMLPWLRRWEQAVSRDLLTPDEQKTHFAEHLVDGLLRGDIRSRYAAYGAAIKDGWMNRNEVRILENLNPVDGLDEFLEPLNMGRASERGIDNAEDSTDPRSN